MSELNRRNFLRVAGAASAGTILGTRVHALASVQDELARAVSANDHIQIALIGAGGQGQGDTKVAVQVPGVKCVAVADCYNGRLERAKEIWGPDTFTTRDYNEILARKDIDAVLIATPAHWHATMVVMAAQAGKDFKPKVVYPYHYRGSDVEAFETLVGDAADVRLLKWY